LTHYFQRINIKKILQTENPIENSTSKKTNRLIIVSNRLPLSIAKDNDSLSFSPSPGGLSTGISALDYDNRLWIGWPGIASEEINPGEERIIKSELKEMNSHPVFLDKNEISAYYYGFSNRTIWPLFHYFPKNCIFEQKHWEAYKEVNEKFCREILSLADENDTIWIHDYQLLLLPQMIREKLPNAKIGFFLHIPFPSFELIRLLPWRKEILLGMMGADLIGFHEYDYVRHFFESVHRIAGYEHNLLTITAENRIIEIDAFPMGIDYEKYSSAVDDENVKSEIKKLREQIGNKKLILSIDRLDYTKGIINRMRAFSLFLEKYPQYIGEVSLVILAVPSRTEVDQYIRLRDKIEGLVGRINGQYGTIGWTPIHYMFRALSFPEIIALYYESEIALITPIRDGMNLVAKEYIASKERGNKRGVLILSEMTGAACELSEAIIINPQNRAEIADSIEKALTMSDFEAQRRNHFMQNRLSRYTVKRWASEFIKSLDKIKNKQKEMLMHRLNSDIENSIIDNYKKSQSRLILLDYDGTLSPFFPLPEMAKPSDNLMKILTCLCEDEINHVAIISGRDKKTLSEWFAELKISLVAEHGNWSKRESAKWQNHGSPAQNWKEKLKPVMEVFVDRTPGSFIEEKEYSLVWHYRQADKGLAQIRMHELKDALLSMTGNLDLGVFEGNKIIEIKSIAASKGTAVSAWLSENEYDFIFCAGDDYTDEDMFAVLPENAFSIKIGNGPSKAKFSTSDLNSIHRLLESFANGRQV